MDYLFSSLLSLFHLRCVIASRNHTTKNNYAAAFRLMTLAGVYIFLNNSLGLFPVKDNNTGRLQRRRSINFSRGPLIAAADIIFWAPKLRQINTDIVQLERKREERICDASELRACSTPGRFQNHNWRTLCFNRRLALKSCSIKSSETNNGLS